MALNIYNVLGRKKTEFQSIEPGYIGIYVCGPTVQDYAHLGHGKTYVSFDVIVRWLRKSGYSVLYVQNITDVGHLLDTGEDRILKKARQTQAKPMQLVDFYTREWYKDMDAMGIQRPDINPRASAHVPEQIKMVQTLIDKEYAYEANGSVYFDVTSASDYGKLSNRRIDMQEAGSREAVRDEKRHAEDFALWKNAQPEHILRWDSPWGEGFPGWHIECSAMAKKYLGDTFDIHGGGVDNIFPHNESEIVQSECANDAEFAKYWMLVGSLMVPDMDGIPTKMSKSLGNFVTLRDALAKYRPEVIRTFVLSAHYSSPVTYSEDSMKGAQGGWERLNNAVWLVRGKLDSAPEGDAGSAFLPRLEQTRADFAAAMDDDFNAPIALSALQELTREVNTLLNGDTVVGMDVLKAIDAVYSDLAGDILGIIAPAQAGNNANAEREAGLIKLLIEMRNNARKAKDFAASDRIRDELTRLGVTLGDTRDGTLWKV